MEILDFRCGTLARNGVPPSAAASERRRSRRSPCRARSARARSLRGGRRAGADLVLEGRVRLVVLAGRDGGDRVPVLAEAADRLAGAEVALDRELVVAERVAEEPER